MTIRKEMFRSAIITIHCAWPTCRKRVRAPLDEFDTKVKGLTSEPSPPWFLTIDAENMIDVYCARHKEKLNARIPPS